MQACLILQKNKETYFIDAKLNTEQEKVLNNWTEKIKGFYEGKIKIPYKNYVAYLCTTPISKKNAWLFVTYPTIAIIGHEYNLKYYFKPNENVLRDSSIIELLSHELGHYYFGTMFVPNAELRWFFLEGLTEYLALQTIKEVLGENYYKLQISAHVKRLKDFNPKSLTTVKSNEIDQTYRYKYIPLLITALEKEIGKEKVWNWLATILQSDKSIKTDYDFLKNSLLKSGITETEFKNFEEKYILSEKAKENVIKLVGEK